MKRFAVRSLAFALALAAGTAAAQDYYDDRGSMYGDDYAGQDDGYYGDDAGYYGDEDAYAMQAGSGYYGQSPSAYPDPRVSVRGGYGYGGQQSPAYDMARVVSVDPIVQPTQPVTRQQCWSEPTPSYAYQDRGYQRDPRYASRSQTSGGGALLGAIAGGVLGNSVGDGDGRKAATIAGAVIGYNVAGASQRNGYGYNDGYYNRGGYYDNSPRCRTVTEYRRDRQIVGYDVTYDYRGRVQHVRSAVNPGDRIRVRVDVRPEV